MNAKTIWIRWQVLPVAALLFVCGCASNRTGSWQPPDLRTVNLSDLSKLKAEGVTQAEVTQLLGTQKGAGTTSRGTSVGYFVKVRYDATDFRGRAPLSEKEMPFHITQFEFDANQKVCFVLAPSGGKLDEAPARAFKAGVTTKDQVYAAYGYPDWLRRNPDGSTIARYSYQSALTLVKNSAKNTFDGRVYALSHVTESQTISIAFDAKGVIQELNDMHFGVETNYQFKQVYSTKPLNTDNKIPTVMLSRLSPEEVRRLFGNPDSITLRSWGETEHTYSCMEPYQRLCVTFGPDNLTKRVSSYGTSPNESSKSKIDASRVVWNTLLTLAFIGSKSPRGPAPTLASPVSGRETQSGTKVDSATLENIQIGKSTHQDIEKLVGVPDTVNRNEDGSMTYGYSFYYYQSTTHQGLLSITPTVTGQSSSESCILKFDSAGVLKEVTTDKSSYSY